MLSFKPAFSLFSFTFINSLLNFSLFSSIMVASYVYPRLLIFLLAILISVCASSNLVFPTMYSAHKLNKQGDRIQTVYDFEPVHHSISGFYCCFLSFIQVSQEAGKVVWNSNLLKNFPQFAVIHTVKGLSVVSEAEVDVYFWNSLTFSMIQQMLAIWSLVPLPFLNPAWTSGCSWFMFCWSLSWRILSINLLVCEMKAIGW